MPEQANQLRWLWLSWLVLVMDQFSKWFAVRQLSYQQPFEINSFFNLTLDFNRGAAFSFLGDQSGWQIWLFGIIAALISFTLVVWMRRLSRQSQWTAASLALIIGGAMGNLVDRVIHGHVIDFLSWHYQHYYWPTFNIADSAVFVGAFLLIMTMKHDNKE